MRIVKVKNLQTALELAGNMHNYQLGLIIVLCCLFFFVNFILIGPSYIFMNPTFKCLQNGQQIIKQQHACHIIDQCQIIQSFTLTSKLKLYCENQSQRVILQTVFSIGSLIGILCMNTMADTKGRRISTQISLIFAAIGILLNVEGGRIQNFYLLVASQIMMGFGGYSLFVLSFIILGDFCQDSLRQTGIVILNASSGIFLVFMGVFYSYQLSWIVFLETFLFIPLVLILIIISKYMQQAPYILMLQGKKQQCLNMLKRICGYNKTQQNISQIQMLIFRKQSIPIRDERPYIVKILSIIKKCQNLKIILLIGFLYAIGNIMYFGIQFTFQDQGYNYGVNSMIIGGFELVSFGFLHVYMQRLSRTKGVTVFFGATAFIGLLFLIPPIQHNNMLSSGLIGISRIFFTVGYTLIICLQTESFDIQIASTAAGIVEAMSLLGIIVAPSIVSYSMSMGINPIVVLSLLLVLGIVPNLFITQTNQKAKKQGNKLFVEDKSQQQCSQELISVHSHHENS